MSSPYSNITLLRRSHFGDLYRATDTESAREVVIRRLFDAETASVEPDQAPALARRTERLIALQHPNVATILGSGTDADGGYVVSEWIEGAALPEIVSNAALTIDDFAALARQSLDGLSAIHQHGLVHGSLTPKRLVIDWQPDNSASFRITDLGLAELLGSADLVTADARGGYTGVLDCLAPELFDGQPGGARSDLYALGNIFYFALTQNLPFAADTADATITRHRAGEPIPVAQYRQDLPVPLADWVMSLIAFSADERPQSAVIARESLERALSGETATAAVAETETKDETTAAENHGSSGLDTNPPSPSDGEDPEAANAAAAPPTAKTARVAVRTDAEPVAAADNANAGESDQPRRSGLITTVVGAVVLALGLGAYFMFFKTSDDADASAGDSVVPAPLPTSSDGSSPDASAALVDPHLPPVTEALLAQFNFDKHDATPDLNAADVSEWPKRNGNDAIGPLKANGLDPANGSTARHVVATPATFPALNGQHTLLQLTGKASMDVEWQRDSGSFSSGDQLTCIVVFWSAEKNAAVLRMHSPIREEAEISTRLAEGALVSGIEHLGQSFPIDPYPNGNQFMSLSLMWAGNQDSVRQHIMTASGQRYDSPLGQAPNLSLLISSLHLGGNASTSSSVKGLPSGIYFAELLLYDRALSSDELALIGRYLALKYFL